MRDVAIVGAGELGGALAYELARGDLVKAIRLIDEGGGIATGKALDIMQASPIEGFATQVSGTTDLAAAAGAGLIVVTDRRDGTEWQGEEGLMLLARLSRLGSSAIILCAGASQRQIVERGVRELGYPRGRLFGSAPEALASAVRAIVALETNGSPNDVALTLLGIPPSHIVVPWEDVAIGGFAATRLLDATTRRRIAARVAPLWPPGSHTLAWAAVKTVKSVIGRSLRTVSAFVAPDDSSGRRARAAALPVRLGPVGIVEIETPRLDGHDRVVLDNAMLL